MFGREILEKVIELLGQVPEGDEAEELCENLAAVAARYRSVGPVSSIVLEPTIIASNQPIGRRHLGVRQDGPTTGAFEAPIVSRTSLPITGRTLAWRTTAPSKLWGR